MADNNKEQDQTHELSRDIKIADEVIGSIAGLAATDVDGVAGMAGTDMGSFFGISSASKGVRAVISGDRVSFRLSLVLRYGANIPSVCAKVQEKVRSTVENMTGLSVGPIDVIVAGMEAPTG